MFASNRQGAHFSLGSTFLFDEMPSFRDTLTLASPAREERLRDPALREQMRAEIADPTGRSFVFVWQVLRVETVEHERNRKRLARAQRCTEIADDRAATSIPSTRSSTSRSTRASRRSSCSRRHPTPTRRGATRGDDPIPVMMAGSSDGGAHLLSFCGADYTTRLLTEWVPDVLALEDGGGAAHVGARLRRTASPTVGCSPRARPPTSA